MFVSYYISQKISLRHVTIYFLVLGILIISFYHSCSILFNLNYTWNIINKGSSIFHKHCSFIFCRRKHEHKLLYFRLLMSLGTLLEQDKQKFSCSFVIVNKRTDIFFKILYLIFLILLLISYIFYLRCFYRIIQDCLKYLFKIYNWHVLIFPWGLSNLK